jgi:hemolysin activation/secretion protein
VDRGDLRAERFLRPGGGLVLRVGLTGTALAREDSLPPSEAVRLGGASTVRGYREEQFAVRRFGAAQVELGFAMPQGRVYAFADGAWYRRFAPRSGSADLWGVGVGLASETPARRIGLDLGLPRGGRLGEGRLHLRLETRF